MPQSNAVAKKLRVFIGTDLSDWSEQLVFFSARRRGIPNEIRQPGLCPIEATLTLQQQGQAESIDRQINASRWAKNQPVLVQIPLSNGAYVTHPHGRLFILAEPDIPAGNQITLELGCFLAQGERRRDPDGDESGVTYGDNVNFSVICDNYLQAADISSSNTNIATFPFTTAYPVGRVDTNYIEAAGNVAIANKRVLYTNSSNVVQAQEISLTPTTPAIALTQGVNLPPGYDETLRDGTQEPVETTRVAATVTNLTTWSNPGNLFSDSDGSTIRGYSFRPAPDPDPSVTVETVTTSNEDLNILLPNSDITYVGTQPAERITETKIYDPNNGAPYQLTLSTEVTRVPRGLINPSEDSANQANLTDKLELTISYAYDNLQQLVTSITEVKREPRGLFLAGDNNPYTLVETERKVTSFTRRGKQWIRRVVLRRAAITVNGNTENPFTLVKVPTKPEVSDRGQTQPPQAEYFDGPYDESSGEVSGEATLTTGTGLNREEVYYTPIGISDAQCADLAAIQRDLNLGRSRGAGISLEVNDTLLSIDVPLFQVSVAKANGGPTLQFLCNDLEYTHTTTESVAYALGIWVSGGY